MKTLPIAIDEESLAAIDRLARTGGRLSNRSQILRQAVQEMAWTARRARRAGRRRSTAKSGPEQQAAKVWKSPSVCDQPSAGNRRSTTWVKSCGGPPG